MNQVTLYSGHGENTHCDLHEDSSLIDLLFFVRRGNMFWGISFYNHPVISLALQW